MSYRDDYSSLNLEGLREAVMDELAREYSVDNISMEEYDQRCGKAARTQLRTELVSLIRDLPLVRLPEDPSAQARNLPSRAAGTVELANRGTFGLNLGKVKPTEGIVNVFFGSSRRGVWKPARTTSVINVFGGTDIDLSQAQLPPEGITIHIVCVFGGCDIKVPEGVNVEVRGFGVFGGFDRKLNECDDPGAPTIVVDGIAIFGGCDVKTKRAR